MNLGQFEQEINPDNRYNFGGAIENVPHCQLYLYIDVHELKFMYKCTSMYKCTCTNPYIYMVTVCP